MKIKSKKGGWNFKKEVMRKVMHILFTIILIVVYFFIVSFFDKNLGLMFLVLVLIIILILEYFRIETCKRVPLFCHIWSLRREREKDILGAEVFSLIGIIIAFAVFDFRVAIAIVLMACFGDSCAALFGILGKHKINSIKERSWEGVFSEFLINLVVGSIVFSWLGIGLIYSCQLWIIVISMSLIATIVETISHKMEDNLLIQIIGGFVGQILVIFLGF
jgi:dolichol kinase